MNKIKIEFDKKSGRFMIECPFYANDLISDLTSKRWSKPHHMWMVPAIRRNVEHIRSRMMGVEYVEISEGALAELNKPSRSVHKSSGFPSWYKFKTKPRDHQRKAYDKLYGLTAIAMHMDRGTGKSKTAIDIACCLRMEGKIDAVLVVCKLSLRRNWLGYDLGDGPGQKEGFIGHAPIDCDVFLPNADEAKQYNRWLAKPHDFPVLVVGTESLSAGRMYGLARQFMMAHSKVMMIIDESHMISNHRAIRSERCIELGRAAAVRASLTGTPISTGPMNLFMQFEYLDPDIIGIGDYYAFRNRYAVMGGYRDPKSGKPMQIVGYQNMDELASLVAPHVFEVKKSDVLNLPPKVFEKRFVQLTPEQRKLYNEIKKEEAYVYNGKEVVIKNVLELALRLHQVAGGFVTTQREEERIKKSGDKIIKMVSEWHPIITPDRNPKIIEILDIAEEDKQQIVWCAYRPEIEAVCNAIRDKYPNELVREIHGGISENDREIFKNEFQSGKAKFLIGNTATGGVGLTLTAAEIMTYYNNTEKMIDRLQSEDRPHRDGLQHSVLYIDLLAEKTVDETFMKSIEMKMDLAEYVRQRIRHASDLIDGVSG